MTTFIKSTWNPFKEKETKIEFSQEWEGLTRIAKLDHLKDTLAELEVAYNNEVALFHDGKIE